MKLISGLRQSIILEALNISRNDAPFTHVKVELGRLSDGLFYLAKDNSLIVIDNDLKIKRNRQFYHKISFLRCIQLDDDDQTSLLIVATDNCNLFVFDNQAEKQITMSWVIELMN
ncbi:hypothetical protein ACOME3_006380 [Neoechinorhynchus agilis]